MNYAGFKTVCQACGEIDALAIRSGALACVGNLCRCTGYASQMRALAKFVEGRRGK